MSDAAEDAAALRNEIERLRQRVRTLEAQSAVPQGLTFDAASAVPQRLTSGREEAPDASAAMERELRHRLELERMLAEISRRFIAGDGQRLDAGIDATLEELAQYSGADRCYVLRLSPDGVSFSATHEWGSADHAAQRSAAKSRAIADHRWAWETLLSSRALHIPDVEALPAEAGATRELILAQGIRSLVLVPLNLGGRVAGALGLDRMERRQAWPEEDIRMLRTVADIIAGALLREHYEQVLRDSEQKFFGVFASSPDVIGLSRMDDATLLDINPAFERIIGFERHQAIGRKPVELGAWIVPEDWTRLIEQVRAQGAAHNLELRLRAKDGTTNDALVSARLMQLGEIECVLVMARDITERRRAERAVLENEARLRQFAEHLPFVVWMSTPEEHRLVFVNAAYEKVFGRSRDALQDNPNDWLAVIHPEDLTILNDVPDLKTVNESYQNQFRILRQDGSVRWLSYHVIAMRNTEGEIYLHAGITEDVTERKEAERQIREMNAMLESRVAQRTAALESSLRELESFSYSVSHDLRTPLRGINGFSHLLLEDYGDRLDDTGREYVNRICTATQRMGDLIDDLLTLAHISRADLAARPVDLTALATDVIAELRQFEPQRKVDAVVAAGVAAQGDPTLLRILLENLLGNAWKFTVHSNPARIEFGVIREAGQERYFVRDNGIGFDNAFVHKLFQPFQRLHPAGEYPGSGIGLATVSRIVGRHSGRAWGEGQPGVGAVFYFTLG